MKENIPNEENLDTIVNEKTINQKDIEKSIKWWNITKILQIFAIIWPLFNVFLVLKTQYYNEGIELIGNILFCVGAYILWVVWRYITYKGLQDAEISDLKIKKWWGWLIFWDFCPIVCLWKWYQIIKDIVKTYQKETNSKISYWLVKWRWWFDLISVCLNNLVAKGQDDIILFSTLIDTIVYIFMICIINKVQNQQQKYLKQEIWNTTNYNIIGWNFIWYVLAWTLCVCGIAFFTTDRSYVDKQDEAIAYNDQLISRLDYCTLAEQPMIKALSNNSSLSVISSAVDDALNKCKASLYIVDITDDFDGAGSFKKAIRDILDLEVHYVWLIKESLFYLDMNNMTDYQKKKYQSLSDDIAKDEQQSSILYEKLEVEQEKFAQKYGFILED